MNGRRKITVAICFCAILYLLTATAYAENLRLTDITSRFEPLFRDSRGTIAQTGEAKDFFAPDTATVSLAVETSAKTANEAVEENGKRAERVIRALRPFISSEKGESVKTSSFSVQPVYEYDNVKRRNFLTGYRARHQVTVTTKKVGTSGEIIDTGVQSGANEVGGVTFSLTELKDYCEALYKKASEKARSEAAFVAQTLGQRIAGVKNISSTCGTEMPRPLYRDMGLMAAEAAPPGQTGIEAGDISVTATVSAVFYIEKE
jgi:uncharacterized protein